MRTYSKTLIAAGLLAAFAAPFAQASAQSAQAHDDDAMQSENQTVPGKLDDAWITTKVKSELATTKGVHATDINVSTHEGVVTLSGQVAGASEKMEAERVARSVKGVKSVDTSGLVVGGMSAGTPADHPASSAGEDHGMKAGAKDAWITTKVKSKFAAAKGVHASHIKVDTRDGVVTLTGTVSGASELSEAKRVALGVKGVTSVDTSGLVIRTDD